MKVYSNNGNAFLARFIKPSHQRILDVGCGDGGNARLFGGGREYYGITLSEKEKELASLSMTQCFVADIERDDLEFLKGQYDLIMLSHVLEHLIDPQRVVEKLTPFLKPGGEMLIAVPNILAYKFRVKFLFGDFSYEDEGTMDHTHLHFYTYHTAPQLLPEGWTYTREVEPSIPLWPLRRLKAAQGICKALDSVGGKIAPNLFGGQVVVLARRKNQISR